MHHGNFEWGKLFVKVRNVERQLRTLLEWRRAIWTVISLLDATQTGCGFCRLVVYTCRYWRVQCSVPSDQRSNVPSLTFPIPQCRRHWVAFVGLLESYTSNSIALVSQLWNLGYVQVNMRSWSDRGRYDKATVIVLLTLQCTFVLEAGASGNGFVPTPLAPPSWIPSPSPPLSPA